MNSSYAPQPEESSPLKISVITPTLNQAQFIKKTIQSVCEQDYPCFEHIIIDGGSTDRTVEILANCKENICWVSEPDKGQADAINKGIKKATGDIIAFLNSDDYYLPGTLHRVAEVFRKDQKVHWVTGDYQIVDKDERPIQSFVVTYKRLLVKLFNSRFLKYTNYIAQPSTFWKREIHDEIGFFDDTLHLSFDYEFWLRLMRRYPVHYIDHPLSAFRIHKESKGGKEYKKQFEEEYRAFQRHNHSKIDHFIHKMHNKLIVSVYHLIK